MEREVLVWYSGLVGMKRSRKRLYGKKYVPMLLEVRPQAISLYSSSEDLLCMRILCYFFLNGLVLDEIKMEDVVQIRNRNKSLKFVIATSTIKYWFHSMNDTEHKNCLLALHHAMNRAKRERAGAELIDEALAMGVRAYELLTDGMELDMELNYRLNDMSLVRVRDFVMQNLTEICPSSVDALVEYASFVNNDQEILEFLLDAIIEEGNNVSGFLEIRDSHPESKELSQKNSSSDSVNSLGIASIHNSSDSGFDGLSTPSSWKEWGELVRRRSTIMEQDSYDGHDIREIASKQLRQLPYNILLTIVNRIMSKDDTVYACFGISMFWEVLTSHSAKHVCSSDTSCKFCIEKVKEFSSVMQYVSGELFSRELQYTLLSIIVSGRWLPGKVFPLRCETVNPLLWKLYFGGMLGANPAVVQQALLQIVGICANQKQNYSHLCSVSGWVRIFTSIILECPSPHFNEKERECFIENQGLALNILLLCVTHKLKGDTEDFYSTMIEIMRTLEQYCRGHEIAQMFLVSLSIRIANDSYRLLRFLETTNVDQHIIWINIFLFCDVVRAFLFRSEYFGNQGFLNGGQEDLLDEKALESGFSIDGIDFGLHMTHDGDIADHDIIKEMHSTLMLFDPESVIVESPSMEQSVLLDRLSAENRFFQEVADFINKVLKLEPNIRRVRIRKWLKSQNECLNTRLNWLYTAKLKRAKRNLMHRSVRKVMKGKH